MDHAGIPVRSTAGIFLEITRGVFRFQRACLNSDPGKEYDARCSCNIIRRAICSPTPEELPREIVRSTLDRASRICQVHIVSRLAVKTQIANKVRIK